MIPNNITRKHLEKAIEEIDRDGVKKGRSRFMVFYFRNWW